MRRVVPTLAFCWCAAVFAAGAPAQTAPQHTVSILADGRDELRIGGGGLVVRHFSWQLPTDLVVDGVARPLAWSRGERLLLVRRGDPWLTCACFSRTGPTKVAFREKKAGAPTSGVMSVSHTSKCALTRSTPPVCGRGRQSPPSRGRNRCVGPRSCL